MKCSKETWIRTIVLIVSLVNQVLTVLGKNPLPFSDEAVYQGVSAAVTTAASLWAWWKNNSFTTAPVEADQLMQQMKKEQKK